MSHSISKLNDTQFLPVLLTIVNYTAGGETVTAAELGALGVDAVLFGTVPASQNSLAVPLFPILDAGKIKLFRFTGGVPVEIATTNALNASIAALVHVTGWTM